MVLEKRDFKERIEKEKDEAVKSITNVNSAVTKTLDDGTNMAANLRQMMKDQMELNKKLSLGAIPKFPVREYIRKAMPKEFIHEEERIKMCDKARSIVGLQK